jgi:hypothetical protein
MNIDRELLEAAAKAAGYKRTRLAENGMFQVHGWHEGYPADWEYWDPLTDDGDALRLAVILRITPHIDCNMTEAEAATQAEGEFFAEPHIDDPYASTRRAIVRAAAAIREKP